MGKETAGVSNGKTAPASLLYSANPAKYTIGQTITDNLLTSSNGFSRAEITPSTLPEGLVFDGISGTISGTPTTITDQTTYRVKVYNGYGSSYIDLDLSVGDVPPTLTYSGSNPVSVNRGDSVTITPTLGGGAIIGCMVEPALPASLSLNMITCEITGTANVGHERSTFTVYALNSGGAASYSVDIEVIDFAPAISYPVGVQTVIRGATMTAIVPTSTGGGVTSCSVLPALPAGIALFSNCTLSGTPTAVSGSTAYTVTATNNNTSTTAGITLKVDDVLPNISYVGGPYIYQVDSAVSILTPTNAGGVIDHCTSTPALPSGLQLSDQCVISGTPTSPAAEALYTIDATNTKPGSGSTSISIQVNDRPPIIAFVGGPYTFKNGTAIPANLKPIQMGGAITSCSSNPALPAGISLGATDCMLSGTPVAASSLTNYVITASNTGGSSSSTIGIKVDDIKPVISYAGNPFSYQKNVVITPLTVTNSGGAIASCVSVPALPPGLTLSSACMISGMPTGIVAATNYDITATNTAGSSTATINITVNDMAPAITYAGSPYQFPVGVAISTIVPTNTGGVITNCVGALPAGLNLNATTCAISGTPLAAIGASDYNITASNLGGNSPTQVNIMVYDAPVVSYALGSYTFTKGVLIGSVTPNTAGGGPIASCSISPALPAGLSFSNGCVISGTPTVVSAAQSYAINATNLAGSTQVSLTLDVKDVVPTLSYVGSPFTYTKDIAIANLTPTLGGGAVVSCEIDPPLPNGLSLSSQCVISGTPSVTSNATPYTVTAINSGGSVNANITISVGTKPVISFAGGNHVYWVGDAMSALNVTHSGGAISNCVDLSGLPAGMAVDPATCAITGTPSAAVVSNTYTIRANNIHGSTDAELSVEVKTQPEIVFYSQQDLPGPINPIDSWNIWKTDARASFMTALTGSSLAGRDSVFPTFSQTGIISYVSLRNQNQQDDLSAPEAALQPWKVSNAGAKQCVPALLATEDAENLEGAPVISPDGTKIAFSSKRAVNLNPTLSYNLWVMDSNCGNLAALTGEEAAGYDSITPVFSPNSQILYFASRMKIGLNDPVPYNIWKVNVDGTGLGYLTSETVAGRNNMAPQISPDGNTMVYVSKANIGVTQAQSTNIWKMNASDGTGKSALTQSTSANLDSKQPQYTPDGTQIVFASMMDVNANPSGAFNIWKMSASGASKTALTQILANGKHSERPHVSPDGGQIVFMSKRDLTGPPGAVVDCYNIAVIDFAGTLLKEVTQNSGSCKDSLLSNHSVWYQP